MRAIGDARFVEPEPRRAHRSAERRLQRFICIFKFHIHAEIEAVETFSCKQLVTKMPKEVVDQRMMTIQGEELSRLEKQIAESR